LGVPHQGVYPFQATHAAESAARKRHEKEARAKRANLAETARQDTLHSLMAEAGAVLAEPGDAATATAALAALSRGSAETTPTRALRAPPMPRRESSTFGFGLWSTTRQMVRAAAAVDKAAPCIETVLIANMALPLHEAALASKAESRALKQEVPPPPILNLPPVFTRCPSGIQVRSPPPISGRPPADFHPEAPACIHSSVFKSLAPHRYQVDLPPTSPTSILKPPPVFTPRYSSP